MPRCKTSDKQHWAGATSLKAFGGRNDDRRRGRGALSQPMRGLRPGRRGDAGPYRETDHVKAYYRVNRYPKQK